MISANKGEWSEIYVLFKILGETRLYAADGNLNKLEAFYPVIKIIREELERKMGYYLEHDIVIVTENQQEVCKIDSAEFLEQSEKLFQVIRLGKKGSGSFEIPSLDKFLGKIHCSKVKAKSKDKADIHVVIHDYHTGMRLNLGFSIKSELGGSPTLLNASTATRFVFQVNGREMNDNTMESINDIKSRGKIMDRVNAIYKYGMHLDFSNVPNEVLRGNLCLIDSNMPLIVGWMMLHAYLEKNLSIERVVQDIKKANPCAYELAGGHDLYGYKIKSLMVAIALGMLPATPWDGKYDATGGYIVVKEDGEIVCFHIYDRNLLEDYLYKNTKFETPSTSRYDFGYIYKIDDSYYFDLLLQIRFK